MKISIPSIARAACAALLTVHLTAAVAAVQVGGVSYDDRLTVASQPLQLNGAGVRAKMVVKVYAIGLYLPQRATTTPAVLSQPGAKSLRIVMLREVSADRLVENLLSGIADNSSPAERSALQSRVGMLERSLQLMGSAPKGGVISLDYVPNIGTLVSLSGVPLGPEIPGEDFYHALLKIWLGDKPSDRDLRRALLGDAS